MAQGQAGRGPLIDSDRVEGTPVYSRDGGRIGTIQRMIIDQTSGRVVYVVIAFAELLGLGDVTYVIPWSRLLYDTTRGGYHTDITEAGLRSAIPVAQGDVELAEAEPGEAFFSVPPGWRFV
jgi:sporulation protein YlmC with PRC-barrel domain